MDMLGIGLDLMSVVITFVILIGVLLGKKNSMNEYFPMMLLLNAFTLLADIGTLTFRNDAEYLLLLKICWILQFTFAFCQIAAFNLYVDVMLSRRIGEKPLYRVAPFIMVAIMIILWITSLETDFLFSMDEQGIVSFGRFFWVAQMVGCSIAIFDVIRVVANHVLKRIDGSMAVGVYIFVAIPMITLPLEEIVENQSLLFAAITVSYVVMYILIHVRQEQVVLAHQADAEKRQTELILSQLQPHFIFNSLTTMKYLCSTNPHLATEAITHFSKYFRGNLDVISNHEMVKFKEELEHTKNYLWLEQLRFGKLLNVEYSIDCDDFLIPPLSLQPIVENAVKHGVTKKTGGGTVSIVVREEAECYRITVSDDGVGFSIQEKDKEAHLGINDVRKRIAQIKDSTLKVTSQVGIGTSVVFEIMKDG